MGHIYIYNTLIQSGECVTYIYLYCIILVYAAAGVFSLQLLIQTRILFCTSISLRVSQSIFVCHVVWVELQRFPVFPPLLSPLLSPSPSPSPSLPPYLLPPPLSLSLSLLFFIPCHSSSSPSPSPFLFISLPLLPPASSSGE